MKLILLSLVAIPPLQAVETRPISLSPAQVSIVEAQIEKMWKEKVLYWEGRLETNEKYLRDSITEQQKIFQRVRINVIKNTIQSLKRRIFSPGTRAWPLFYKGYFNLNHTYAFRPTFKMRVEKVIDDYTVLISIFEKGQENKIVRIKGFGTRSISVGDYLDLSSEGEHFVVNEVGKSPLLEWVDISAHIPKEIPEKKLIPKPLPDTVAITEKKAAHMLSQAKILLAGVISRYPNTRSAKEARKMLE